MRNQRVFKTMLCILCTIAFTMTLLFPVFIFISPLIFLAAPMAIEIFLFRKAGILSALRSVCMLE